MNLHNDFVNLMKYEVKVVSEILHSQKDAWNPGWLGFRRPIMAHPQFSGRPGAPVIPVRESEDILHVEGCNHVWAGDLSCETKALVRQAGFFWFSGNPNKGLIWFNVVLIMLNISL